MTIETFEEFCSKFKKRCATNFYFEVLNTLKRDGYEIVSKNSEEYEQYCCRLPDWFTSFIDDNRRKDVESFKQDLRYKLGIK